MYEGQGQGHNLSTFKMKKKEFFINLNFFGEGELRMVRKTLICL